MRLRNSSALVVFSSSVGAIGIACSGVGDSQVCDNGYCNPVEAGVEGAVGEGSVDGPATGDDASPADASDASAMDSPNETSTACDGGIVCSGQCVDPSQAAHCGSCTNNCAAPTSGHGQATCTLPSTCGVSCTSGFHVCNGDCLADSDDPSADACVIADAFGVFVSTGGNDSNACTKTAPCRTIAHAMAIAKAASKRTYVCEGTYDEQLVVDSTLDNIKVFGGFSCTGNTWVYDVNKKPLVAPSAHGYAMVISTPTSALFEDVAFQAQAGTSAGESSIAIFAKNAAGVVLRRCNVSAGNAVQGTDQSQPAPFSSAAPSGNTSTGAAGGAFVQNSACTSSISGAGGQATVGGQDGTDGTPGTSNKGTSLACIATGTPGGFGANGGAGGNGAGAATWATFTTGGWAPSSGGTGGTGTVGQGGGGGASADTSGGGGGGGAGGCGGVGGPGGTGGGSAIALLSFSSSVDLESSTLSVGNAGRGGNGGAGQTGQTGGTKGNGAGNACAGGKGGNGGNGGTAGGGAGGLSSAVLWAGTAPVVNGTSTPSAATLTGVTLGAAGAGGTGASAGKAGVAAAVVQFQ